jgi:hypothetical protein
LIFKVRTTRGAVVAEAYVPPRLLKPIVLLPALLLFTNDSVDAGNTTKVWLVGKALMMPAPFSVRVLPPEIEKL